MFSKSLMDRLQRDEWNLLESIGQRWIQLTPKDDIFKVTVRLDTPKVYLRLRKHSQMIKGTGNNVVHRRPLNLLSGHE